MKLSALLAGVAAIAMSSTAMAQDSQAVDVESFSRVDAGGGYRVVVTPGDTHTVRLEGDGDDFSKVEIDVRRDGLYLDQQSRLFGRNRSLDVTVYVTMPTLNEVDFGRGVRAEVDGFESSTLEVDISTGASVSMSGSCGEMDISGSTGAMFDGRNLECEIVDVSTSTGASVRVHARQSVDASASLGGDIVVYGSPQSHDSSSSMGGSIRFNGNG
ncbi:MAG: head GIN domain-containing protein [Pseudomonadota bacterium]|nr:head GIN domain-containing protein [Pseudomonadota bacterium]